MSQITSTGLDGCQRVKALKFFAFSSNGDGFIWPDRTAQNGVIERELTLDEFPAVATLPQAEGPTRSAGAMIAQFPLCLIGMEARSGAHYWAPPANAAGMTQRMQRDLRGGEAT